MKKETRKIAIFAVTAAIAVSGMMGCNSGGGAKNDPYYHAWYDVFGNYCHTGYPSAGCNYYSDGYQIIDTEDPYYYSSYNLQFSLWKFYDTYGFFSDYLGWAWLSPTGVLYDEWGNALNENEDSADRDIIADVAKQEQQNIEGAGKTFAAKYALAEDVGVRVAKTLNDWAVLGKGRARTTQDIADFSQRLFGVDFNKVVVALDKAKEGDKTELNNTISEMATYWGTTPETSKAILKNAYKDQLKDFNID